MTTEAPHPKSFLARLDARQLRALDRIGMQRTYQSRTVLFHQGDPSRHVLLVHGGWVKVSSTSRTGEEALLAIRGPGDVLGELAAVDELTRSATVTALVSVSATLIAGERFLECLTQETGIVLALLRHISGSLRESDRRRLEYVSTNSSARVAALILKLAAEHGTQATEGVAIQLPLTQHELALAAATSREVVARTLRALRERDIVITQRQRITVLRSDVLESLCTHVSVDT
jgi:CRP/FNR family transcriptional regulator, cyclic AMP receptor protein